MTRILFREGDLLCLLDLLRAPSLFQAVVYLALTLMLEWGVMARVRRAARRLYAAAAARMCRRRRRRRRGHRRCHTTITTTSSISAGTAGSCERQGSQGELSVPLLLSVGGPRAGARQSEAHVQHQPAVEAVSSAEEAAMVGLQTEGRPVGLDTGNEDEDEDVAAERVAIEDAVRGVEDGGEGGGVGGEVAAARARGVLLCGVRKTFHTLGPLREALSRLHARLRGGSTGTGTGMVQAVRGLWLAIPPGQCFGLLGVNGAGV